MRIQHNIMAMNAYRNYTNNTSALSKNLEKLSSGYKINRAGDDAAGLAISEKMRAQITGLDVAQKNAKDGISLVQTAEGALTEVHDMLNRMYELAEQSANGTYQDEVDRDNLQAELDALRNEIDRISQSANFNGIKLFTQDGAGAGDATAVPGVTLDTTNAAKLGAPSFSYAADATDEMKEAFSKALGESGMQIKVSVTGTNGTWGSGDKITLDQLPDGYTYSFQDATGKTAAYTAGASITVGAATGNLAASTDLALTIKDKEGNTVGTFTIAKPTAAASGSTTITLGGAAKASKANAAASATAPTFTASTAALGNFDVASIDFSKFQGEITADTDVKMDYTSGTLKITVGSATYTATPTKAAGSMGSVKLELKKGGTSASDVITVTFASTVTKIGTDKASAGANVSAATVGTLAAADNAGGAGGNDTQITLQIGEDGETYNQLTFNKRGISTKDLGIDKDSINIDTQQNALDSLESIKNAINTISSIRGDLGAIQNRLDHTINNLSVMQENIQDAESTIRDTDVADEMMAYTKNNILVQSAQAMLAQANQVPQGVLQLLQ